jgi:uroporphyrin-III C-methyltransferase/precorrin-2 dehydrogenase/sirohydrochlorin ferrochelatase
MDFLPLFLDLKQQACLVVGGGEVAARKTELLCRAGARVTVVGIRIAESLRALQSEHALSIHERAFEFADLEGMRLVVSATDDNALNTAIATAARQQNLLVNVVDTPPLCNFIFPAIIDRSPVIAAVSSGGASPVLARILRAKIEAAIPAAFGKLAQLAGKFRPLVKQQLTDATQRRIFWEKVLQGPIAELVFNGQQQAAEEQLRNSLLQADHQHDKGEVYLIGAGPGDPDLLTFRALRLLQQADVIVYDRLVSVEILDMARRDAQKIYVGKQRNQHSLPQESINALLADLALQGKRVARLKGGDPFIFGRGGEEIETLMQQGIRFQVVPGITAASGCASYAGIPLTHRDHAQSCIFVTGHLKDGSIALNWPQLAAPNQTVVIYMGLVGLSQVCQQLIAHGCAPEHPIALIQQGTTTQQRVITGTLADMSQQVGQAGIKAPTLIIIGTVVNLHSKLKWFQE